MSPVLPFDIIALIIDIVRENKDTNLLKELALVSYSFHQICSKHIFAAVVLYSGNRAYRASSKNGFVKLLKSRPDVVKHIRKLTYRMGNGADVFYFKPSDASQLTPTHPIFDHDDHLLSPILPNLLRTIPRLNCLKISASNLDWNQLNSSLTSALLYLMHLPTLNHLDLSYIHNFPFSSLTPSVNLLRLDTFHLSCVDRLEDPGFVVEFPKIREFHTSESPLSTRKLLHAKKQDGRPAFNFMDLRQFSMTSFYFEDESDNIRYLLQNAKLLEKLHLKVAADDDLVGLLDNLSPTLKVLDLTVFCAYDYPVPLSSTGLYEELEAMAGHNMLEALSFKVQVDCKETEDTIGSIFQKVEEALLKPGWSALRRVSFIVSIISYSVNSRLSETLQSLQSLPDKYVSHLPKLESVAFNFSVYVENDSESD